MKRVYQVLVNKCRQYAKNINVCLLISDIPILSAMTETQIAQNAWPYIERRDGLIEGSSIYTTKPIPAGQFVCSYGGEVLEKVDGKLLVANDNSDYLIEFKVRDKTFFYNNPTCIGYGGYLNHSKKHPNVYPKLYLTMNGKPEIMFIAKRKVPAGIELVWDYGHAFKGVSQCVLQPAQSVVSFTFITLYKNICVIDSIVSHCRSKSR